MKILKSISIITYTLIIGVLVLIAGLVAVSVLPVPGGIKLFTVQSGSMEPAIWTGSVVVVQPKPSYAVNDVITFISEEDRGNQNPKFTTTHRVISLDGDSFQTKGDANDAPDGSRTKTDLVIGKVILSIPYVGFPVNFAKTREGLIILIIVPATLIVYNELMSIKQEIIKLINQRKKQEV